MFTDPDTMPRQLEAPPASIAASGDAAAPADPMAADIASPDDDAGAGPPAVFSAETTAAAARLLKVHPEATQERASLPALHELWRPLMERRFPLESEIERLRKYHASQPQGFAWGERTLRSPAEVDEVIEPLFAEHPDTPRAEIEQLRAALKAEIADHRTRWEQQEQRIAAVQTELNGIEAAIETLHGRMLRANVETIADIAVLLDLAMDNGEIDITSDAGDDAAPDILPYMLRLLRSLVRLAPSCRFVSLETDLVPGRLATLLADPDDQPEAPALAAE
jgi:hypothetical protein